MSLPYGDPPVLFTDSVALVFCNRLVAVVLAVCMTLGKGESLVNKTPLWKYLAIFFSNVYASACQDAPLLPDVRPPAYKRTFTSVAVDSYISEMAPRFKSQNLSILWSNCLPNTLDTTVAYHDGRADTFVITGDINAMWLRDSTNQVLPYARFAASEASLADMMCGLVRRQARSVLLDAYANAFNFNASGAGHQDDVRTPKMTAPVYEGKYELDSLAAFLKLSWTYWNATQDGSCFVMDAPGVPGGGAWLAAVARVLEVVEYNRQSTAADTGAGWWYAFQRETVVATDTLMQGNGRGPPAGWGGGLSKSFFRPSDDGQTLPFLVPANAMTLVELLHTATLLDAWHGSPAQSPPSATAPSPTSPSSPAALAARARALAAGIEEGLWSKAVQRSGARHGDGDGEAFLAYEVDGFGSAYFMDDANVPSLLSLPYLGLLDLPADRPGNGGRGYDWASIYAATRARVLSGETNPFFFKGTAGEGVGGPHVGYGQVWPMSIVMRAITSDDDGEIAACLDMLVASSAGTGLLHESFDMNDAARFTRPWFAWVDGLFGELINRLIVTRPWLVLSGEDAAGAESARSVDGVMWI